MASATSDASVVLDPNAQRPPLTATPTQIRKLLTLIQDEILPITKEGVQKGNKVFGAAIVDESLDTCLYAATNEETTCPLFHGEVHCIYQWSQQTPAAERGPLAQSSVFVATHEPCCMCISSIVWSGFTKVYYLFPYSVTTAQGIPHDIQTMHELWGVPTYRKQNKYCSTACLMDLIADLDDSCEEKESLLQLQKDLITTYNQLAEQYHGEKADNPNNSLVLG